jgi:hypothetical protein
MHRAVLRWPSPVSQIRPTRTCFVSIALVRARRSGALAIRPERAWAFDDRHARNHAEAEVAK